MASRFVAADVTEELKTSSENSNIRKLKKCKFIGWSILEMGSIKDHRRRHGDIRGSRT
jgi:hypothetical protein